MIHWFRGRCRSCGDVLLSNELAGVCPPCRWGWPVFSDGEATQQLGQTRAGMLVFGLGFRLCQGSGTHEVIHRAKYGAFPETARSLGRWVAERWQPPPSKATLVPVPLHWRRRWKRGFNQAEAFADGLSCVWDVHVDGDILRRTIHKTSLTANTRAERQKALGQVFDAPPQGARRVILVDDVLTTGATARMCSEAMKLAGHEILGGVWMAMA